MEGRLREFYVIDKHEFEAMQNSAAAATTTDALEAAPHPQADDDDDEGEGQEYQRRTGSSKSTARIRASPPPHNAAVDAVLNKKFSDTAEPVRTFLENLNKDAAVVYSGDKRPLKINGVPTKRTAGYYINALTTLTATPEQNYSTLYETFRLAIALKNLRMPTNLIKNPAVINELVVSNSPHHPEFGKWTMRA